MDPVSLLALGLGAGLVQVASKLGEMVVEPALEPAQELLKARLQRGFRRVEKDQELRSAVRAALKDAGAPLDDDNQVAAWLQRSGLARLGAEGAHALRRQVARAVLAFSDPQAPPPEDLRIALGWPREREMELSRLLVSLREALAGLDEWKDLLVYADAAIERDLLRGILAQLEKLDTLVVHAEAGDALRVVIADQELSVEAAERIEKRYRDELVRDLYWHDFRGIVQIRQDVRLPLADIYLELALLESGDDRRRQARERLLELGEAERLREEERRLEQRVGDALAEAQRLVILGEPGAGKTLSLRFIALMLAYGYGAARLGLEEPYIPLLVRLADYARALEANPNLALDNYLFEYIEDYYASDRRLGEYLRLVLEDGSCTILLDGLDEVGRDPLKGRSLRTQVVRRVQQFAGRWCNGGRGNRLVVTSRIEGYWVEALRDCSHVQLSPLRPPEEVEAFLLKWYTAHEQAHERGLPYDIARLRARAQVDQLLPSILEWPSVRRLATNPLLLTILALIHENVGRLPNRRIKLYEIAARTLIESWRQAQVGLPDELLAELGEDMVVRVMAPMAYWLHVTHPGGTASYEDWCKRLVEILEEEGYEGEARGLAERFLAHARQESGLLAERGLGQYGFFHLTFEEYLAARQIARQRAEERREMLKAHWRDPRWTEVILLAAGQLAIIESRTDDVSEFVENLLKMEPGEPELRGRPALLAGGALADIGARAVKRATLRWTLDALRETMQDVDPETGRPYLGPYHTLRTRAEAGDVLDELGWLPGDLYEFVLIDDRPPTIDQRPPTIDQRPPTIDHRPLTTDQRPPTTDQRPPTTDQRPSTTDYGQSSVVGSLFYLARYPVTNAQYARFLAAEDYADPELWHGFPRFDQASQLMNEDWGEAAWKWYQDPQDILGSRVRDEAGRVLPRYWNDARFGIARRGVPLVGISWYEANAYCRWLLRHWDSLEEGTANPGLRPASVRLPVEAEWLLAAGGDRPGERFPWDLPGKVTKDIDEVTRRANVRESEIGRTTPMGMYPLGASQPYGLWDLAGNVWEWQANYSSVSHNYLGLRGGSWHHDVRNARPAVCGVDSPNFRRNYLGFRVLVSPK
jgi:formylglycine-generating enzyme required for sulfatase activity